MKNTLSKRYKIISCHPHSLKSLEQKINEYIKKTKKIDENIHIFSEAKNEIEKDISILQNKINCLKKSEPIDTGLYKQKNVAYRTLELSAIDNLKNYLVNVKSGIAEKIINEIKDSLEKVGNPALIDLGTDQDSYQKRIEKCQTILNLLEQAILEEERKLKTLEPIIKSMTNKFSNIKNGFLVSLRQNPELLCLSFKKRIIDLKNSYEKKYRSHKSNTFEICLYEFGSRLEEIIQIKPEETTSFYQAQYLELCGFLWRMYDSFCELDEIIPAELELASGILTILNDMYINRDEDLPSEMAIGKKSLPYYKSKHKDLGLSTLVEMQDKTFNKACEEFETTLKKLKLTSDVVGLGRQLIMSIKAIKQNDIRFCTEILKNSTELFNYNERTTPTVFDDYIKLANNAFGKPILWKKVAGCMLALAGLAMIGFSVFSAVVSAGLASPLSFCGIKMGASLIVAGYTLLAGVCSLTLGAYAVSKGMRSGLSKKMYQFREAVSVYPGLFQPAQVAESVTSAPILPPTSGMDYKY